MWKVYSGYSIGWAGVFERWGRRAGRAWAAGPAR
jgi:hypothetical protein